MSYLYIWLCALVLVVILAVFLLRREKFTRLSGLSAVALGLIVIGIVFSDSGRVIGYSLMGAGILFSIIDIINRKRHDAIDG